MNKQLPSELKLGRFRFRRVLDDYFSQDLAGLYYDTVADREVVIKFDPEDETQIL